jgi:hypothetical protein
MSHLHQINPRQIVRGIILLGIIASSLWLVTSDVGMAAAGTVLFVLVHLFLGGSLLYAFWRRLHGGRREA